MSDLHRQATVRAAANFTPPGAADGYFLLLSHFVEMGNELVFTLSCLQRSQLLVWHHTEGFSLQCAATKLPVALGACHWTA